MHAWWLSWHQRSNLHHPAPSLICLHSSLHLRGYEAQKSLAYCPCPRLRTERYSILGNFPMQKSMKAPVTFRPCEFSLLSK